MPEWIRPVGCEGGACVEYRTVGGKVFLRNPARPDVLVEFTAAEWDTFVAGLVAPITAERDQLREELLNGIARAESLAAELDKARADYTDALKLLNKTVAEAAVLRRKVRELHAPTLENVEWRHDQTGKGEALVCPSCRPADPTEWHPPVGQAGIEPPGFVPSYVLSPCPTLAAVQEGPPSPPESTESAEQPQPVAQPTDGPEPQGGAQRACGYCAAPLVETSDGWTDLDGGRGGPRPALHWHFPKPEPRVWNAGDPEPEGVEKVTDEDGDTWVRDDPMWVWTDDWGVSNAQDWAPLLKAYGPLTEVLPEPTTLAVTMDNTGKGWLTAKPSKPVTFVICNCWGCKSGRAYWANHPDGEVPEAGRAGEAQTKDQDRTEVGLDAAIEAATDAFWPLLGFGMKGPMEISAMLATRPGIRKFAEAAVRAASPLIERAALLAAAEAWDAEDVRGVADDVTVWLRSRATRTETP